MATLCRQYSRRLSRVNQLLRTEGRVISGLRFRVSQCKATLHYSLYKSPFRVRSVNCPVKVSNVLSKVKGLGLRVYSGFRAWGLFRV